MRYLTGVIYLFFGLMIIHPAQATTPTTNPWPEGLWVSYDWDGKASCADGQSYPAAQIEGCFEEIAADIVDSSSYCGYRMGSIIIVSDTRVTQEFAICIASTGEYTDYNYSAGVAEYVGECTGQSCTQACTEHPAGTTVIQEFLPTGSPISTAPRSACVDNCSFSGETVFSGGVNIQNGTATWALVEYTSSGDSCSTPVGFDGTAASNDTCVVGGGTTVCSDVFPSGQSGENCGTVNGDRVCLPSVPEDGCISTPNGAFVCGGGTSSPPAPDNGTVGQPANPDATIGGGDSNGDGQMDTGDVYNNTTVNNSSGSSSGSPVGEDGVIGTDDGCTGPECTGDEETVSGGNSCSVGPPSCSGSPIQCAQLQLDYEFRCDSNLSQSVLDSYLSESGLNAGTNTLSDIPVSETYDVSTMFDTSGWLARTCPADIQLTVMSEVIAIPLSSLCTLFGWIGNFILLGVLVVSMRIAFG